MKKDIKRGMGERGRRRRLKDMWDGVQRQKGRMAGEEKREKGISCWEEKEEVGVAICG